MTTIVLNRLEYPASSGPFASGFVGHEKVSIEYCCQAIEDSDCIRLEDDEFGIWDSHHELVDEAINYCPFCGAKVVINVAGTFKMVPVERKTMRTTIEYVREEP